MRIDLRHKNIGAAAFGRLEGSVEREVGGIRGSSNVDEPDPVQFIGLDRIGFIYVGGTTYSTDFPLNGAFQSTEGGGSDVFVAKIDPHAKAGDQIVFSTYIGGTANETLGGMAVGANGDVYLNGTTLSADFPTVNPAQSTLAGTANAFVMWINSSRAIGYS